MMKPQRGWRLLEGLRCREGNIIPWVMQDEGNEILLVGITARVIKL